MKFVIFEFAFDEEDFDFAAVMRSHRSGGGGGAAGPSTAGPSVAKRKREEENL